MKPSSLLPFITLTIVFLSIPSLLSATSLPSNATLINQTCRHTPHRAVCLKYLNADPRSAGADSAGLALIMVNALKAETTNALNKINELLQGGRRGDMQKALSECAESYRVVMDVDIPEAIEAVQKGDPKFAENGANDAANEAFSCQERFPAGKSPITHENNVVHDVSQVASAVIRDLI